MTLKEQYWKAGYIFQFREGEMRMVWGDKLIDKHGYIPFTQMSDELVNIDNVFRDRVVAIYPPNYNAVCIGDFVRPTEAAVWKRSIYMMTKEEIKEKLGIPEEEELIVIKSCE